MTVAPATPATLKATRPAPDLFVEDPMVVAEAVLPVVPAPVVVAPLPVVVRADAPFVEDSVEPGPDEVTLIPAQPFNKLAHARAVELSLSGNAPRQSMH
jgi:hypothetical protein